MNRKRNRALHSGVALLTLAGGLASTAMAQDTRLPPNRAYSYDDEKISVINEDTFEVHSTIDMPEGSVGFSWNNAEKNRLGLIIEDGLLTSSATLVVIDLETDTIVNSVEIDYNAERFYTSADGNRAYVALQGRVFRGRYSIVSIDTQQGTILGRMQPGWIPTDFFLSESGDSLILVDDGQNALRPNQRDPARLESYDAATLERRSETTLPGPIDGIYLDHPGRMFFTNPGVDHRDEDYRAQGEVYVVDRETLELTATLEVGMAPGRLAWDTERERFYQLTSPYATQRQAEAQLHLIGADTIEASIDLPRRPLAAQPSLDRNYFYVLYDDEVVRVDSAFSAAETFLDLKDSPVQLFESPNGDFFYALHFDSNDVSVVDASSGRTVDRITTGRAGAKVANFALAAGAQVLATGLVIATGPSYTVNGTSYYNVPIVNPFGYGADYQRTFGTFSEDAGFLYVYNAETLDVTVIDTASNEVVEKVAGGGDEIRTFADGRLLVTVSSGAVGLFDIDANFEEARTYDIIEPRVDEIVGRNKAYVSRALGRPIAVIDLDNPGDLQPIAETSGRIISLTDY